MRSSPFDLEKWLRQEILTSWWHGLLAAFCFSLLSVAAYISLDFLVNKADWARASESFRLLAVYQYPSELLWRPFSALMLLVFWFGLFAGSAREVAFKRVFYCLTILLIIIAFLSLYAFESVRWLWCAVSLSAVLGLVLARYLPARSFKSLSFLAYLFWSLAVGLLLGFGTEHALRFVHPKYWGGALFNILLTVPAFLFALPLAVLLSFAQESRLAAFSRVSTWAIGFITALPIIVWFLAIHVLLSPAFPGIKIEPAFRTEIALILIASAYASQHLRKALESIPKEQDYAARALGLRAFFVSVVVLVPQMFRDAKADLVDLFLYLFLMSSLVLVTGVQDVFFIFLSLQSPTNTLLGAAITFELFILLLLFYFIPSYLLYYLSKNLRLGTLGKGNKQ